MSTGGYIDLLYAIGKKKSPPHVRAHLSHRASAPKELSLPQRHPIKYFKHFIPRNTIY